MARELNSCSQGIRREVDGKREITRRKRISLLPRRPENRYPSRRFDRNGAKSPEETRNSVSRSENKRIMVTVSSSRRFSSSPIRGCGAVGGKVARQLPATLDTMQRHLIESGAASI